MDKRQSNGRITDQEDIENYLVSIGAEGIKYCEPTKDESIELFIAYNRIISTKMYGENGNEEADSKELIDYGVGIRIATRSGLGFAATSSFDLDKIRNAAKLARAVARSRAKPTDFSFPNNNAKSKVDGLYDSKFKEIDSEKVLDLTESISSSASNFSKSIKKISGSLSTSQSFYALLNSNGGLLTSKCTLFETYFNSVSDSSGVAESNGSKSGRYIDALRAREFGEQIAENALSRKGAIKLESGTYDVILGHQPSSIITAHFVLLTSCTLSKRYEVTLLKKKGKVIGSENISLIDDPTMPSGVNSCEFDDDGLPSKKRVFIDNGRFVDFAYDLYSSAQLGQVEAGNGFRLPTSAGSQYYTGKRYDFEPVGIMINPYFKPGKKSSRSLLEETSGGLLIDNLHYARIVDPIDGTFSSVLRSDLYKIKQDGTLVPVRRGRLIDRLKRILVNVCDMSDTLDISGAWGFGFYHSPARRTKAYIESI